MVDLINHLVFLVDSPLKQCYTYDSVWKDQLLTFGDESITYDAWGKILSVTDAQGNPIESDSHIALVNPFRYRGYYYDTESALYYLQTRYYDPETGRFISPDNTAYLDPKSFTGLNLYAYCGNDPVMYADPSGNFVISLSAILIGMALGAIVGLATTAYNDYKTDGIMFNENNLDYLFYGITGAVTGAIGGIASTASFVAQLGVSMILGASANVIEGFHTGTVTEFWDSQTLKLAFVGAATAAIGFSVTYGIATLAAKIKYYSIIGGNTSNHHINQALSAAGYDDLKIGRDGLAFILDKFKNSSTVQLINYSLDSFFNFIFGVQ